MNKLLLTILAAFAISANAQTGDNTLNANNSITSTISASCGSFNFPTLTHVITKDTQQFIFDIDVVRHNNGKDSYVLQASFRVFDNDYKSVSTLNTTTYTGSIISKKNPSTDPVVLEKTPYIYTRTPKEITTGLALILHPKMVNDQIVTNLCFSNSDLVAIRKFSNDEQSIDLPEYTFQNSLKSFVLTPGKSTSIALSKDLDLKITARKI